MKSKEKFINFPLMALAYGTSEKERLETIFMWAIINVGRRALQTFCARQMGDKCAQDWGRLQSLEEPYDLEGGLEGLDVDFLIETQDNADEGGGYAWALGLETLALNKNWRDAETCLEAHARLESFMHNMQGLAGRGDKAPCYVNGMKQKWLIAALRDQASPTNEEGDRVSYSHFAVLAALLSKIGSNKPPCKTVTWPEIQRRALGYATEEEMKQAMPYRQDGAKPLSRIMIDTRTRQLALWGFVLRHVPMIGKKAQPAWYGSGMDKAAMVLHAEQQVNKQKGGWKARAQKQQADQTALAQKVIEFKAPAKTQEPIARPLLGLKTRAV